MESVIQTMTENNRIATILFPATGRPSGVGRRFTTISAMPPMMSPYRLKKESSVRVRRLLGTPINEALAAGLDVAISSSRACQIIKTKRTCQQQGLGTEPALLNAS